MNVIVVTCAFNVSQMLIDCAFKSEAEAKAYAETLNGDKVKAVVRCKELIVLREGEEMVRFFYEEGMITFDVLAVELK